MFVCLYDLRVSCKINSCSECQPLQQPMAQYDADATSPPPQQNTMI